MTVRKFDHRSNPRAERPLRRERGHVFQTATDWYFEFQDRPPSRARWEEFETWLQDEECEATYRELERQLRPLSDETEFRDIDWREFIQSRPLHSAPDRHRTRGARTVRRGDMVEVRGRDALGNRRVALAIADICKVPLSDLWQRWGLPQRFIERGGPCELSTIEEFTKRVNAFLESELRAERLPDGLFARTFFNVKEIEQACAASELPPGCAASPYGAPGGVPEDDELLDGRGHELVRQAEDALKRFARKQGHGICVVSGGPGDGKKRLLARVLREIHAEHSPGAICSVYISCRDVPARDEIVSHLYQAISIVQLPNATVTQMLDSIESSLRLRPLRVVFSQYDFLEAQGRGGDRTVLRDEGLFEVFSLLLSEHAIGTRILIGTTSAQGGESDALSSVASEANVKIERIHMPSVRLTHGMELITRNRDAKPGADACYAATVARHLWDDGSVPTLVTVAFATSFALSSAIVRPRSPTPQYGDGWVPEDFDASEWSAFEDSWREAIEAVRKQDLKALLEFTLRHASADAVVAIYFIALCGDGVKAMTLQTLLLSLKAGHDAPAVVQAVLRGSLSPLVDRRMCSKPGGEVEAWFYMHPQFRRAIVTAAQERADVLNYVRNLNERMACFALRRYQDEVARGDLANLMMIGRWAAIYYTHELASLSPERLQDEVLLSPRNSMTPDELAKLGASVLDGKATPGQRFCYAMMLRKRAIQGKDGLSRYQGVNGLELELLTAPFHVGYLIPPESSPLSATVPSVPMKLPFEALRRAGKGKEIRRERWYAVSRLIGLIEFCLTRPGGKFRYQRVPEEWRDVERWAASALERVGKFAEPVPAERFHELTKRLLRSLVFSIEAGLRDELRCLVELHELWALDLFSELAIAAIRLDDDGIYETANAYGEDLAKAFGDVHLQRKFWRNRIDWMLRRGRLAAGEACARDLAIELETELELEISRLMRSEEKEPSDGAYRELMKLFNKIGGRIADFQAARGEDRKALTLYQALVTSTLATPAGITRAQPTVTRLGPNRAKMRLFSGPSARSFLRCALRTIQIYDAKAPHRELREHDFAGALPVDLRSFQQEELQSLLGLTAKTFTRERRAAELYIGASDAKAAIALERATRCRYGDLAEPAHVRHWLARAADEIEDARRLIREGDVSILTQLRLREEAVRLMWHTVVFHQRGCSGSGARVVAGEISRGLSSLGRIIAVGEVRRLPLQIINALLLRAEILGCCEAAGRDEDGLSVLSTDVTECLEFRRIEEMREADLERAAQLINETGYRKRMVELAVLKRKAGTVVCAHLIA
jgi:hypothetical protein